MDCNYAVLANQIATGRIRTAKVLAKSATFVPDDAQFEQAFSVATVSQTRLARYFLRALECQAVGTAFPELEPVRDKRVLNLEHVLPENPEGNWPEVDESTISSLVRRLGNMVLLQASKNSKLGNQPFSVKRAVYRDSALSLTKEVASSPSWNAKQIGTRQKRLAALALRTWTNRLT